MVIKRDPDGRLHVTTTHHEVTTGTMWGMFWGVLFDVLFFVRPLGMAIGAGLGVLTGLRDTIVTLAALRINAVGDRR
ncbi:MAG: hypothetical protein QOH97_3298 [Actinoplanes sp.]|nr:hypothetical protein [Actinoplanes sp.]